MSYSGSTVNDVEVEDILSKDDKNSPNLQEKPLSPILSGSLNSRKFLIGRRLSRKKSTRVKLSDRFKEEYSIVNPINVPIPISFEDSLSASQSKTLIDHLEKLEELENNRKNLYKELIKDNKKNYNSFKKPNSATSVKINEISSNKVNVMNEKIECTSMRSTPNEVIPIPPKLSNSFHTATGKNISLSETDITKYSKLFEDIICPTQNCSQGRQNKHTFLRKHDSTKENYFKSNTNFNSIDSNLNTHKLQNLKSDQIIKPVQSTSFTRSSSSRLTERAIIQAKTFFAGEEFDDIKFSNENLGGFRKANVQTSISAKSCKKVENGLDTNKDVEFSFTQAIYDSGISNTQILNAFENILNVSDEDKDDFKGFSKDDMKESCMKRINTEKVIEWLYSTSGFSKKRKRSIHSINKDYHCNIEDSKQILSPPKKRSRNYENSVIKKDSFVGFASASGKAITISEKCMKNAETIFNDLDFNLPLKPDTKNNEDLVNKNSFISFQKASGKAIEISKESLRKAKNIFDKLNEDISNEKLSDKSLATFTSVKSNISKEKQIEPCKEHIEKDERDDCKEKFVQSSKIQNPIVSDNNFIKKNLDNPSVGFCKASGKKVKISEGALNNAKNIFENLSMDYSHKTDDQTLVGQTSIDNIKTEHHNAQEMSSHYVSNLSISKKSSVTEEMLSTGTTPVSLHKSTGSSLSIRNSKRKLGISHFKQIQICDKKLDKAKLLFDEDFSGISPIKPKQSASATYTSTPIKQNTTTPLRNDYQKPKNNFSIFVDSPDVTPIKRNVENKQAEITLNAHSKILCISPTKGDFIEDLEMERKKIECRLQVLLEREKLGREALCRREIGKSDDDKKQRKGLLYRTKTTSNQISLVTFVGNTRPGDVTTSNRVAINPKNAENLHFTEQTFSSVLTEDGAIVIPNSRDMVGLPEIKNAFEAMSGVEPCLIPKGWIKNHYKWIIWKLASYENMFPNYFKDCLSIENIMQQLKYRYDREIDRAERSALRKICEKDDASQKRMVLCVSDVKTLDRRKYELELCDGWYALRTIIDEPLSNQILKGKIEIGTKLLISGAELLNCDGCHPLEVTNLVCLKINCNSTRRAIWHAKLGFQRNPNPFPIQLQSIYPLGGTIAAIKICIARVYPLKYMEKLEGRSVWRNKKAEEVAAQKWENERRKQMEQIQHEVRKKIESASTKSIIYHRSLDSDISNIKCPKTLYDILESSNDPECIEQSLSSSQKEAILNYQNNLSMKKQQEIATEITEGVSKMKLGKRDVVAVLKLLVIDIIGDSDKPFSFFIWRPTEAHLQSLKEGKSFTIQNVLPRPNGDLNSTSKTKFKLEPYSNDKCIKYKRRLMPLAELTALKSFLSFNEFDTVGIVVQTKTEPHMQEIWMSDNAGRLLLISIHDGPDTCLLLDNLKRGQATTVCNLIYQGLKKDIIQAVANHFTVFSSYSQHKHLQEGLDTFKKEIAKDVQSILEDCDNKIEIFRIVTDLNSFSGNFEVTDEDTFTAGTSPLK